MIKADKIENRYQTMDPLMFPKINDFEEGEELTIDSGIILESIKKVAYAIPAHGKPYNDGNVSACRGRATEFCRIGCTCIGMGYGGL